MTRKTTQIIVGLVMIASGIACMRYDSAIAAQQRPESAQPDRRPTSKRLLTGIGVAITGAGATVLILALAPKRRSA